MAEFVSVKIKKAILYEGPSNSTKKLFIVTQDYPLQIIVSLKDWKKVKDHEGKISWIQSSSVYQERTVMVIRNKVNLYHEASLQSAKLADISKFVVLKLDSPLVTDGWIKVKSQLEGIVGFLKVEGVWGS